MPNLPRDLQRAIQSGRLTNAQIHELIKLEAKALGLTFEQARQRAEARSLPSNTIGSDLQMLFGLLAAA